MKKVLIFSFFALCAFQSKAQNFKVEQSREATYPDGDNALYTYVFNHLKYNEEAKKNKAEGQVMLSFFVEPDSTIKSVRVLKDVGYGCGDSLKVLFTKLKYIPAVENGVVVRSSVMVNVPVRAH